MAEDPLVQMQQLLQAQQRLWEHFRQQGTEQQPWANLFANQDEIEKTAQTLSSQAKAYGEFAKAFVEKAQAEDINSSDHLQQFFEQFQQYREQLLRQELAIPEGFDVLFSSLGSQHQGFAAMPFMQGQWQHQLNRIKDRVINAEQVLTAFQQAYLEFQALEQQLNQQVYRKVEQTLGERENPPEQLREYVDAWINGYEECYQTHIQTEAYQQSYQALISAAAQLHQQTQHNWDEEYRLFGLVPAGDYDQLLERHHRLQKQVRQQQQQLDKLAEQLQTLQKTASKPIRKRRTTTKANKDGAAPNL